MRSLLAACLALALAACGAAPIRAGDEEGQGGEVGFQLIRNATIRLDYGGTRFLVDPMLADKGAYPGFAGTRNSHLRNPLVDLPVPLDEVVDVDAVVVTHTHLDHWDDVARQRLPKSLPIFVQDERDAATVRGQGFQDVRVLGDDTMFAGTRLIRTGGQHGTDAHMRQLGDRLGTVSGVVFQRPGLDSIYIAGDTTWRPEVETAIREHRPDVIVLNTGYARIDGFEGSIIMGKEDLARARRLSPDAMLIGVHMEAVNHSGQTRRELREYIAEEQLDATRTQVPEDGESFRLRSRP